MWIGLLGTLVVKVNGAELRVAASKQRTVLATLAVRPGRAVPAEMIAEAVWDGCPPASWQVTLRNYLARLRTLLGADAAGRLVTRGSGYLLRASSAEVDLLAFEDGCRAGHAAQAAGDWREASVRLASALALWRGTPFADVSSRQLHDSYLPYLTETRLAAVAARMEAELHQVPCRASTLVPELQRLCSDHPLHERFRAQLMLALYRSGRQAEALGAYLSTRQVFVGELGIEPGNELVSLQQRILRSDPALRLPSRAAAGTAA